jgi:methyltransferase-like protein
MADAPSNSYDELPYADRCFHQTHPDWLATVGTLFGMTPAPLARCRVLELGCAGGGNLIPMAFSLPDSRFVGIDLSARQIARGQELIRVLGLANIELTTLSIMDVDERYGQFDYIICHGTYSWVPDEVQDKILSICKERLAPNGVAYVSYNIYPGWHVGQMIREMFAFHDRPEQALPERVGRARELLDFLAQAAPASNGAYAGVLKTEADRLRGEPVSYFFHEYLEDCNSPIYFHQFAAKAAARGLQFLSEARLDTTPLARRSELENLSFSLPDDIVEREQYFDFMHCRTFRRTLLCHDTVSLQRRPGPAVIGSFLISGHARPLSRRTDPMSNAPEEFCEIGGETTLRVSNPLVKTALNTLFEVMPRAVSLNSLCEMIHSRLELWGHPGAGPTENERRRLAEALLPCFLANLVELHVHVPQFSNEVGARPHASPVARLQCEQGETRLTNLRHRGIEVSPLLQLIVCHLDGSRDRAALLAIVEERVAMGELVPGSDGPPLDDPQQQRKVLTELLDSSLRALAENAFLSITSVT